MSSILEMTCFIFTARLASIFSPANTGRNKIWITEPDRTFFTFGAKGCYGARITLTQGISNFDNIYYQIVLKPEDDIHKTKIQVRTSELLVARQNYQCG